MVSNQDTVGAGHGGCYLIQIVVIRSTVGNTGLQTGILQEETKAGQDRAKLAARSKETPLFGHNDSAGNHRIPAGSVLTPQEPAFFLGCPTSLQSSLQGQSGL